MATKKYVREIPVKESDISVSEIIKKGGEAAAWEQVVAAALLEEQVAQLDALLTETKERIKSTPISVIKKSLADAGKISGDEDASLVITTIYGDELKVTLGSATDSGFTVDKSLSDYIDSLPDAMTRTPAKTLETKKVLEALFDSDSIPDIYKGYFSKHPTEITKMTIKRKEASK